MEAGKWVPSHVVRYTKGGSFYDAMILSICFYVDNAGPFPSHCVERIRNVRGKESGEDWWTYFKKPLARWAMDAAALLRGGSGVSGAYRWRGRLHHIATARPCRSGGKLNSSCVPFGKEFAKKEVLKYLEYM